MPSVVDYASLNQGIQDWLNRSDMAGYVDYFVQEAEERIYNRIFTLNQGEGTRDLEVVISTTTDGGQAAGTGTVPLSLLTGYLAIKSIVLSTGGNSYRLQRMTPEQLRSDFPNGQASGTPGYFSREGQFFIFGPVPDSSYTLQIIYWGKSSPLSSGNTSTWMTSQIPSCLLASGIAAAAKFIKDDDATALWERAADDRLLAYIMRDRSEAMSGSEMRMIAE